jgi:hypothetical protein
LKGTYVARSQIISNASKAFVVTGVFVISVVFLFVGKEQSQMLELAKGAGKPWVLCVKANKTQ